MVPVMPLPRGPQPHPQSNRADERGVLSTGRGRPARTPFAFLVRASPVVAWPMWGASCLSLVGRRICWRVGGTGDISVESLFPEGGDGIELASSSGWSRVFGIDVVGGSPYCDFADEGGARVASRRRPGWLAVASAGVVVDLVGEVGDELGSLCQVVAPEGVGLERWWNAWEPRERARVEKRERCEAPVQHGRHVVCGSKVASAGGCQQVAERVLSGFGRHGEQVGTEGWPSPLSRESGNVLVGLVELCNGLRSDELFGCDMEAVGVALDRLEKPCVVELSQHSTGGDQRFIADEHLLQHLGRRTR